MVLSPAIQAIISGASLPWALRALGFIILGLGILTTVLVRPKTTSYSKTTDGPAIKTAPTQYKFLDLTVLKARGYSLYMFVACVPEDQRRERAQGLSSDRFSEINVHYRQPL